MLSPTHKLLNHKWISLASHRALLSQQAESLLSFFEQGILNPLGGFYDLDDNGRPLRPAIAWPTSPPKNGGWRAQIDDSLRPNSGPFFGKVEIYQAFQACPIPTPRTTGSVARDLLEIHLRST